MQIIASAIQNKRWVTLPIMLFIINPFGMGAGEGNIEGVIPTTERTKFVEETRRFFLLSTNIQNGYFFHKIIHDYTTLCVKIK